MTQSALYEGEVSHRRLVDGPREFRYRLFLAYLDLDELPGLLGRSWLWSARRPSVAWFRRKDYLGPPERPLREAVLDRVEAELGRRPAGAVRVLTHVRTIGYVFNPVSFYYCFDPDEQLEAVVAEITNTPWRERHAYVLDARRGGNGALYQWSFRKAFHVSPFLDMGHEYVWRFGLPGERLEVHMTNRVAERGVFHAGLSLRRRALTGRGLLRALLRYPLLPQRIHLAIYWQALLLFLRRTTFYNHPSKRARDTGAVTR